MSIVANMTDALGRLALNVLKQAVIPAIGTCVLAYFVYYTLHGDRGMLAKARLDDQIIEARRVLAEVRDERSRLEVRADRLRNDHLDIDLLEERARAMLNFTHPRDVVAPLPKLYQPEQPGQ